MFHNVSARGCFRLGLRRINLYSIFLTLDPNPVQTFGVSVFMGGDIGGRMRLRRMHGYEFNERRIHAIVTLDLQHACIYIHIGLGDFVGARRHLGVRSELS
jgi:hypothetical protein